MRGSDNVSRKPSLLMVGHVYSTAINRRKLNAMTVWFDITCVTLPEAAMLGRSMVDRDEDHVAAYALMRLKPWPRWGAITRYCMSGLADVMRRGQFDMVLVDSEPWSWVRWQTWAWTRRFQSAAVFGEFTWENVERPGWKGWLLGWIYRVACWTQDFSISGNMACRALLLKHGAAKERNLVAAQLGVDVKLFRPAGADEKVALRRSSGLPGCGLLVGYCGRFTEAKGLRDLLRAMDHLTVNRSQAEVCMVMMGDGDLMKELQAARETRPWLHLLDPRPHHEVADFMRMLDMFVLPSRPVRQGTKVWEEQFGHVLIEAMASGVATLGARSGAIPEVIGMEEALFESQKAESLAEVMGRWLGDDEARRALAQRQRTRILEWFSHEALAKTWCEFLTEQWRVKAARSGHTSIEEVRR
jgi:glycosyltransferase involved in cell wall biosynthesis